MWIFRSLVVVFTKLNDTARACSIHANISVPQQFLSPGCSSALMELREYQSLPDSQLPVYNSLDVFWAHMVEVPKAAGDVDAKRFGHLAKFCKILLVLPHSTADPERFFSMIGKVDTSQHSSLLALTVCDILSIKDQH